MTQITDAMLKEWEGLCEAASEGPWGAADWESDLSNSPRKWTIEGSRPEKLSPGETGIWPDGIEKFRIAETSEGERPTEDAAFIAAARTALPLLLAEVRRLRNG